MTHEIAKRIMIVDSGKNNLSQKIRTLGFTTEELEPPHTLTETDAQNLLEITKSFSPDLLIGDFFGKQCDLWIHRFRAHSTLSNVPIILCAGKQDICRVIRKINGNVNDYMVQPFIREEIRARIQRVLSLHENLLNTNPLSHLPGNITIKAEIMRRNLAREDFSVIYLDLDNFKAFNDYYGYSKGDEVIQYVAELLKYETRVIDQDNPANFIGHIGGDDFVIVRPVTGIENFCRQLLKKFDSKIHHFYSEEDRKQDYIVSMDRKGHLKKFPIMTLSAAVVINHAGSNMHYGEISSRGSEIKHYLKKLKGSNCLVDRRQKRSRQPSAKSGELIRAS